ncbi:MAG: carbon starvation protein A [Deltaproteobacteria bacterium]|nr:carbon starvation protein A [Deltaproteobacteria bacterium]
MPVLPFLIAALCLFAISYRFYSAFIAAKVLALDENRPTPATTDYDGHNFYPTNKWVLFGHHFAAITGAGPLIGPVLAAQFGFLPGFLWLVIGVTVGGAVHDLVILSASVRHGGRSIAEIARREIGPVAGTITSIAILFIVVIALAGLGLAVVNALSESAWGTFTIAMSVPLALAMGVYMYKLRGGADDAIKKASIVGVCVLLAAVIFGKHVPEAQWGHYFHLSRMGIIAAIAAYGFIASVLPVWILLCPRDYLSSYMKLGTIFFLVLAVFIVRPDLKMPAVSAWAAGGGPIIPGKVFPFVFITIACGAISGFHSLIASGTTPKMIKNECDIRPIGFGAMLLEGLVGVVALIAASALNPEDYFAINVSAQKFATLGMTPVNLPGLELAVGERVAGRPGGAVSLAVGMAQIFSSLPFMRSLMSYWYHFAIMFEALFILTTIDTGTRVARFLVQEAAAPIFPRLSKPGNPAGALISSALVVGGWTYFIATGTISTIWPMFGIANQLLAMIALCIATTFIINSGRARYAWVTVAPMLFVGTTTITAAVQSIFNNFIPAGAYLSAAISAIMLACVFVIFVDSARRWLARRWLARPSKSYTAPSL